ncbi:MAG: rhomboid family intramembrane serine protease [Planctomycetota bacterium]|jgi:membrane associated rhomboid family serine protease
MFIPLRTDRPPRRKPLVTQWLILVNLAVWVIGAAGDYFGWFEPPRTPTDLGHFDPEHFKAWQLVTYQFLHDPHGIMHLAFNMLFLWVFGAAVEDRLGRLGFLGFYLTGGIVAALAHAMINPGPVIGASGSIAGVTGAFLALFPRSRIQVLIFFFIVGLVSIPSLWFIGIYIAIDVLRQLGDVLGRGGSNVAYMAHLAGYVYGFGTGFALLATKILKREEFDVFFLFTQARRRAAFRSASREGPSGMWDAAQADTAKRLQRRAAGDDEPSAQDERNAELRARIGTLLASGDVKAAARVYQQVLAEARAVPAADAAPATTQEQAAPGAGSGPAIVLTEQGQLDVASQLYAQSAHGDAATAYELLLEHYPTSAKADEVRLILGLLYARHLDQPVRARALIEQARPRLREQSHTHLADQVLTELEA